MVDMDEYKDSTGLAVSFFLMSSCKNPLCCLFTISLVVLLGGVYV